MQGKRVGYAHQVERPRTVDGRDIVEIEQNMHMGVQRYGQKAEPTITTSSIETPDDQLISFRVEVRLGQAPTIFTGRVENDKLLIETETSGQTRTRTVDWPDDARGVLAVEHSLRRKPMQPGEQREIRHFEPTTQTLISDRLEAKEYQETDLLAGKQELLRIESTSQLPGQRVPLRTTLWTTRDGQELKFTLPGMETVVYRVSEEEATAGGTGSELDLGESTLVKLSQPLENARSTRRVRYQVELADGDPAEVFAVGPTQQRTPTGPHTAEITVTSVDPMQPSCEGSRGEVTDADRKPNSKIQSDDPRIVSMAREVADDDRDAGALAVALEKLVYEKMLFKRNYSTAFATAAEVAESLEGDCSEHAVLLAALLRARGLPARVAMGLVYSPADQAFAYHMWTEVFLGECWVPLDATLGQGSVSADHLKLSDSNLADDTWLAAFAPVAEALGQLRIEVLEAE
ncbi:MAG TPA: transglutaminase family protein [Pirellulales bacterium]|nr:transglutaminase family protein [Pirellulales bacterium]